jgi:hypothetical protein
LMPNPPSFFGLKQVCQFTRKLLIYSTELLILLRSFLVTTE